MLVLSRRVGERLVISDNITVVVQRVAGRRVSIGIEAPDEVRIVRGELQEICDAFASPDEATDRDELPALGPATDSDNGLDVPPRAPR